MQRKADVERAESSSQGAGLEAELDKEAELVDELERKLNEKSVPQRVNNVANNSGLVADDQTQCKIIALNNKMFFVIFKDNLLYRRDSLTRAVEVRYWFFSLLFISGVAKLLDTSSHFSKLKFFASHN